MRSLKRIVQSLRESQFFEGVYLKNENNIVDITLLRNGQIFRNQLLSQWTHLPSNTTQRCVQEHSVTPDEKGRLSFLNCNEFKKSYQELRGLKTNDMGSVIVKTVEYCNLPLNNSTIFCMKDPHTIRLVSDNFVNALRGLDTFYSIQRERKIWWMRYSADPSRYFVEPFDLSNEGSEDMCDNIIYNKCRSMTIKSSFACNTMDIESITLVRSNEFNNFNKELNSQMALIRSVIDLNFTTCALLLDSSGHHRKDVLMLNRKLAPYQCLLATLCEKRNAAVDDLCRHLGHVLRRTGLRLYDLPLHTNSKKELNRVLVNADNLGVPYVILVEIDSLNTGLLKLRSRDTSLDETIHISDVPTYLLKIFEQ